MWEKCCEIPWMKDNTEEQSTKYILCNNVLETKIKQSQGYQTSHDFFASFHILLPSPLCSPVNSDLHGWTAICGTIGHCHLRGQSSRGVAKPASFAWEAHPSALSKALALLCACCHTQSVRARAHCPGLTPPLALLLHSQMCSLSTGICWRGKCPP